MSRSRPLALALLAIALCALGLLAAPALVAGAHAREGHPSARRGGNCRRNSRHRHREDRCRAARQPVKRHAGAGDTTGAGASPPATPPSFGTASGAGASSPPSEPASTSTETPAAETPAAPATARVQVIAKEYSFTLSRTEVPAGKVIVEFVDGGEDPHNLHLEEPSQEGEAGAFPTSPPGFHGDLTLNLHPGTYTLFCSLPGHEAKGMKATLTVQ